MRDKLASLIEAKRARTKAQPVSIQSQAVIQPQGHQDHTQRDYYALRDCILEGRRWSDQFQCWILEDGMEIRRAAARPSNMRGKTRYCVYSRDLTLTDKLYASNDEIALRLAIDWCLREGHSDLYIRVGKYRSRV